MMPTRIALIVIAVIVLIIIAPSLRIAVQEQLRQTINGKTATWGVVARGVEIKDAVSPRELQDAMSRQAQALANPPADAP